MTCAECGHERHCHARDAALRVAESSGAPHVAESTCLEEGCRCERFIPASHMLEEA